MKYSKSITGTVVSLVAALAFAVLGATTALSQTLTVLHTFTGGGDNGGQPGNSLPLFGLAIDQGDKLYGVTSGGEGGNVFQLRQAGTGWIVNTLHAFTYPMIPYGRPVFGPDGKLYGAVTGGGAWGCGIVYRLTPPGTACESSICAWREDVLYTFGASGSTDACDPSGALAFDQAGNIYGTTQFGGTLGRGTVFELIPAGPAYTESVLYSFGSSGSTDGLQPMAGVALDPYGNLYGTTYYGGLSNSGTLFSLEPVNGGWDEFVCHSFADGADGRYPTGGLVSNGGTTFYGFVTTAPEGTCGNAFEFTCGLFGQTYSVIYSFSGCNGGSGGGGFEGDPTMDAAGNLYGTAATAGTDSAGLAFELTFNGQTWTETVLHNFTGGSDGAFPYSNLVLDASGNLYGSAPNGGLQSGCGGQGCGTVYQIKGR